MRPDLGGALISWVLLMWFSPKIAGALDVLLAPRNAARLAERGGSSPTSRLKRSIRSFCARSSGSAIRSSCSANSSTATSTGWVRSATTTSCVGLAIRDLWPQTLVGCLSLGLVLVSQPWALPYILLLAGGPAFAAPFAVITAWPVLGSLFRADRHRPPSGGDRNARGSARACLARDHSGKPAASDKLGLADASVPPNSARHTQVTSYLLWGPPARPAMDRLHGNFVSSGDLVFDVGAHVGDRVASFRRLGARVVAVEPQRAMVRVLGLLYGSDPR